MELVRIEHGIRPNVLNIAQEVRITFYGRSVGVNETNANDHIVSWLLDEFNGGGARDFTAR